MGDMIPRHREKSLVNFKEFILSSELGASQRTPISSSLKHLDQSNYSYQQNKCSMSTFLSAVAPDYFVSKEQRDSNPSHSR